MDIRSAVRANIRTIAPYVAGTRPPVYQGRSIKLASNENAWGSSPLAMQAIREALDHGLQEYPDSHQTVLRQATVDFWARRGISLDPVQVVYGDGSGEVLSMLMDLFLSPGDTIVLPEQSFILYTLLATRQDARILQVPRKGWRADWEALAAAAVDSRILLLANPDNPTSSLLTAAELQAMMDKVPASCIVLLDEAYIHFAGMEHSLSCCLKRYPNLVVSHTFSKAYGLAALRVGYALLHPELAAEMEKIRLPFNLGIFQQAGATAALTDEDFLEYTVQQTIQGRDRLCRELPALGLPLAVSPAGNFVMVDLGTGYQRIYELLSQRGISIRNLASFGYTGRYARITVGREEELDYLLEVLSKAKE